MSNRNDAEPVQYGAKSDLASSLMKEVGHFNRYQFRTMALCCLSIAIIAMAIGEYVFTTARINTRCLIPECESTSSPAQFAPEWILNAIPGDSVSSFDSCQRYSPRTLASNDSTCPANFFDTSILVNCDQYVYENQLTIVYDFNLGCDEWRRSLSGFARISGMMIGIPMTGYISDRWGRRTAIGLNAFNTFWVGLSRYWAASYNWFVAIQVVESVLGAGLFTSSHILIMELVGPKYRTISGAILLSAWAGGQVLLGLVAWAFKDWRSLTLAIYIPQIITLTYIWKMSESIRWHMSKGRYVKAEELLIKAAKVNGKTLSDKSREALWLAAEKYRKGSTGDSKKKDEPWLVVQVFKHKSILLRCIVSPICWMSTNFVYYGLTINAVNMGGNVYLNFMAISAADIPGFWLSVFLMRKVGRKPVLIGGYMVCAACMIAFIFVPSDMYGLSLAIYFLGKSSISLVVMTNYIFTAELYPTKYRHRLFAFSSTLGRLGNITAPLTPAIFIFNVLVIVRLNCRDALRLTLFTLASIQLCFLRLNYDLNSLVKLFIPMAWVDMVYEEWSNKKLLGAATFDDLPIVLFGGFALLSGLLILLVPETRGAKLPDTMEEASAIGAKQKNNSK